MKTSHSERIARALDTFRIELPSWGFSNTGTRFGKYLQPAAALTIDEKFSDARRVHQLTGLLELAPIVQSAPGIPGGPILQLAARTVGGAGGLVGRLFGRG